MAEQPTASNPDKQPRGIPKDSARLEMMRRQKQMTAEERVALFERLSRGAAWIRSSAKRIR